MRPMRRVCTYRDYAQYFGPARWENGPGAAYQLRMAAMDYAEAGAHGLRAIEAMCDSDAWVAEEFAPQYARMAAHAYSSGRYHTAQALRALR